MNCGCNDVMALYRACRAINAFGDRDILFRSNVRRVLMDCLGVDTDPGTNPPEFIRF